MSNTPTWSNIPNPPAPTAVNQFPSFPYPGTPHICLENASIPDQKFLIEYASGKEWVYGKFTDLQVTVTAQWVLIVEATATPATPFKHSESYTTGTSATNTDTNTFAVTLGVQNKYVNISATMTEQTSHSVTFTESKTITNTFSLDAPKSGSVSACFMQPQYTYHIVGKAQYFNTNSNPNIPLLPAGTNAQSLGFDPSQWSGFFSNNTPSPIIDVNATLVNTAKEYIASQFPAGATVSSKEVELVG